MNEFYYDANIEHMTEIIKNILYFAVLGEEESKTLKNTKDVLFFNIDEELLYLNYYFDFGPLNLSCLFKYCCKLNNYVQYARGAKRVVHYTSRNPIRRTNAAYLMGCYMIIYLQMNPKDIYRTLLTAGGPFKYVASHIINIDIHTLSFVCLCTLDAHRLSVCVKIEFVCRPFIDASRGFSHYTINVLDCFNAIQKALAFNFFNFADFNMVEYDMYGKLQNGDMNWLLPRKFLAFMGPMDSTIMNGHPPNYYIKYFLESDIKTVIRLNNKVYDASVFTNAGIEHHELYFPDGTIPTKQILLRFLNLCENARAAIAVHCKAGLGRTGSLIGAYIIKHYHMTAHEVIAWMRICRPGSVIGQQQGWLEKIEAWLWQEGSTYRIHHFGDGDKIPHHKYGIYSKTWPSEREKLIRHVQRRRLETRRNLINRNSDNNQRPESPKCTTRNFVPQKPSLTKNHNLITNNNKFDENKGASNTCQRKLQSSSLNNRPTSRNNTYTTISYKKDFCDITLMPKRLVSGSKFKDNLFYGLNQTIKTNDISQRSDRSGDGKLFPDKVRKRNQSETREPSIEYKLTPRIQKSFVHNLEQTQGDKLNEIKAKRDYFQKDEKQYKADARTLKKHQVETMFPIKQPQLRNVYLPRN